MRIVYIGCVKGSVLKLEYVLEAGGEVAGVITLDPLLKARHADYAPFDELCNKYDIPLIYVQDINAPSSIAAIQALNPDIIFMFGWSQIIKKQLLDSPPMGVIGFHPTLLPKNRGRHPIIWTLVNGLQETGATFFIMDEGVDSGDIIAQQKIIVNFEDDAAALMKKVNEVSRTLIHEFVPALNNNTFTRISQDHSRATYMRKRIKQDGYIDWNNGASEIYNLVRGLGRPYPGASSFYNGTEIKVWKARIRAASAEGSPGDIVTVANDTVIIQTGNGTLEIVEADVEGVPLVKMITEGAWGAARRLETL